MVEADTNEKCLQSVDYIITKMKERGCYRKIKSHIITKYCHILWQYFNYNRS